jgi:hypothetical protein
MENEREQENIEISDDRRELPAGQAPPPELETILRDLRSPDANTRARAVRALCPCRGVDWGVPIFRYVREMRYDPNPIVRRAVRHDLQENPWWNEHHEARPDVGPEPRTVRVALAIKGWALSDLCDYLRAETGVPLVADASVADEKVALFCQPTRLRDIMRPLSRALGYAWTTRWRKGEYRYDLVRDPAASSPGDARTDARLAHDRTLRMRVTVRIEERGEACGDCLSHPSPRPAEVTSADVLEVLHQATGIPIVAEYSSGIYPAEAVSAQDQPLFVVLSQIADTMSLRWHKETDGWLQFRNLRSHQDRLTKVPNRVPTRS